MHTEACPEEDAGDHVGVAIGREPAVFVSREVSQFEQRSSIEQCFVGCTRRGGGRRFKGGWVDDLWLKLGWSFPGARSTLAA